MGERIWECMIDGEREHRSEWFKVLACSLHTWPILGCEPCFDRMEDRLEALRYRDFIDRQRAQVGEGKARV